MAETIRRLKSWLASPRFPFHAVILATALAAPTLANGVAADDLWHRVFLLRPPGWGPMPKPWPLLFSFFDTPEQVRWLVDQGFVPWWTDPSAHAALFRPLSSATHALDYALWPNTPVLMHVQSLVWAAALVAVAAWVYRRLLGASWIAGLATLLYAIDPGHGMPVGWLANRNALVAGVFAIASLGAFDVAARSASRAWTFASAASLALALSAGENGTAAAAFLVAYALFLDTRSPRARLLALSPHAVVVVAWALVYRAGGFGVAHSAMYIEPLRMPGAYALAVVEHLPLLVANELGGPPVEPFAFFEGAPRIALFLAALVALAWAAVASARLIRTDARARFFAAGGVLAVLPGCATFPAGRLLLVAGFALFGLLALVAANATGRAARAFVGWACWAHLAIAVPFFVASSLLMGAFDGIIARFAAGTPPAAAPVTRVMLVNAPDVLLVGYVLGRKRMEEPPAGFRLLTLAGGRRAVHVQREDDRTIIVTTDGGLYRVGTELLVRGPGDAMPAGTRVELEGVSIEVRHASAAGVPDAIAFRFDAPLDDPSLAWRRWEGHDLVPFTLPAAGEVIDVPGAFPPLW